MSKSTNIWLSYNRKVIEWTRETWQLQSQALQNAIKKGTDKTVASLQFVNGRDQGMIDYAAFKFDRIGIFIEKGVGGVYTIDPEGSGIVSRKTPGEINRQPHPWLKPSLEKQIGNLTNIVSEEMAKVASGSIAEGLLQTVKIKGLK